MAQGLRGHAAVRPIKTSARDLAPIVLFVYNRPDHTLKTIKALKANTLASESDLFIFSDAPRDESHQSAVTHVREFIRETNGFKSVTITERSSNFGLAKSIIDGVGSLIKTHKRLIILEDDLVTSPSFLAYMNNALNLYEHDEKVLHISGSIFPVKNPEALPETFFYRATSCWGWATWERAWLFFEPDSNVLARDIKSRNLGPAFDIDDSYPYSKMLIDQANGRVSSWAIRWYGSVFLRGGMCLHPRYSLVNNIGHDGSGIHCITSGGFEADLAKSINFNMIDPVPVVENIEAVRQIRQFFIAQRPPFLKRVRSRLIRELRGIKNQLGR